MATLDSFTLVAGTYTSGSGIKYDGFIASQSPLTQIGTINGSTSSYPVNSSWYNQGADIYYFYHLDYYVDQVSLRLATGSSIPSNSGWADVTTSTGFTYNRVDASYSTINNTTYPNSAQWTWAPNGNPFTSGSTYNVVVTDGVAQTAPTVNENTSVHVVGNDDSATTTIAISLSDTGSGGGSIEYNVSTTTTVPTTGWSTTNDKSVTRGTSYYLWARNGVGYEDRSNSAFTIPYKDPDTVIDNIPDKTIGFTAVGFSITISGGSSFDEYQVRNRAGTETHESIIGNGTLTVTDAPAAAAGSTKDYSVYVRKPINRGGNNTYVDVGSEGDFTVTRDQDTAPDQFDLGPDVTGQAQGQYVFRSFVVAGITGNATFTGSATGGGGALTQVSIDGSSWTTAIVRTNGQTVYVRAKASTEENATTTHTVTASGISDSFTITTVADASGNNQVIPLGISSPDPIDLESLRNFFGRPVYNSDIISMSDLYGGGDLVPAGQNPTVPTSGQISLSDLYDTKTILIIDKQPVLKSVFIPGGQPAGTATISWSMATGATSEGDVDIGYKAFKHALEYRWVITRSNISGNDPTLSSLEWGGTTYTSGLTFPYTTPWVSGISTLNMDFNYGVQTGSVAGTATLEIRKIWNGSTYSANTLAAYWEVVVENAFE